MSIGERLREERDRLGLSQAAFGEIGGVKKLAQANYEKDDRSPDAYYLAKIASAGADVLYVITGERTGAALSKDELELMTLFRNAPLAVKAAAVGALKGGSSNAVGISIGGDVQGQVVHGDLHQRDVAIGPTRRTKGGK